MHQWDTKIHARCLYIGKEVLKYTDIKILKKVKELKKKKNDPTWAFLWDGQQTNHWSKSKTDFKRDFCNIILIFQKKTRWDIIPRVRLGGCLFKAEHLLAFPTYFFGVGSLIKPM